MNDRAAVDHMGRHPYAKLCRCLILVWAGLMLLAFAPFQSAAGQETEPISYLKKLPGTIVGDLSALPTDAIAPRGRPGLLLGLAAVIAGPLGVDEEIRDLIQPPSEGVRQYLIRPFMLDRTDLAVGLHAGAFGLLGAGWVSGSKELTKWGAAVTETVLLLDVLVLPMKVITGRSRPRDGSANDFSPPGSVWDAFPSGHTAYSIGLASLLSHSPAPVWTKALLWAGSSGVALQRIFSDEHWISDVVVGALLGMWAGRRVAARYWDPTAGETRRKIGADAGESRQTKSCSLMVIPYPRRHSFSIVALYSFTP